MNREADKPGDEVEIYVLGNWQYFEAMKWPRPDMAIRHYQHNRVAFARDKVAVEHRREAASEKNRQLRDSGARSLGKRPRKKTASFGTAVLGKQSIR